MEKSYNKLKKNSTYKQRGKLKIFLGYAAGVGKTYAMLDAAQQAKRIGIDVLVGYVEPHKRLDTNRMLKGLKTLPNLIVDYKGIKLNEFDIDTALKLSPTLILVDELAHTNAPGSRNLKRYQDIEELLKAGIDVYTTINIQHIESLNDIVYQITKIEVNERIPDSVFDDADKVELIDVEPEELIQRLKEGKIYQSEQARRALENFFTTKNLAALREISLRRTADQINKREEDKLKEKREFYTNEHILICLSSSPSNAKVIRTAARMAASFHGYFTALFVETPDTKELLSGNIEKLRSNLKLAEQLGAKIETIYGDNVSEQIAEYAKANGVSKIIIGRSNNKRTLIPKPNFVEQLIELAPNLDIYIIPDNTKVTSIGKKKDRIIKNSVKLNKRDTLISGLLLIASTIIGWIFYNLGFNEANIIIIYILGVLITAVSTYGRIYSLVSSGLSVIIFNYFFTEPRFSLDAYDPGYPVTFIIMFIVAIITSNLATQVKNQAQTQALKAQNTRVLLETSELLQKASGIKDIYEVMGSHLIKLFKTIVIIYPVNNKNNIGDPIIFNEHEDIEIEQYLNQNESAVANWVLKNNKQAGATTNTLSAAKCMYIPVRGKNDILSVIAIGVEKKEFDSYQMNLLVAMIGEFGLALENEFINQSKKELYAKTKQEQLRSNLLRAISHDLRTPLTSISGNANILMSNEGKLDKSKKMRLYTDIYDDSMWLINLVENLLSVTRIENSNMSISMQPELIEDVINEALEHINRRSSEYKIITEISNDLLMAMMDSRLIIQVLINLINNAIEYTAEGTTITIKVGEFNKDKIFIEIADTGEGISNENKIQIFDMFFTSSKNASDSRRGLGLGLPLCKSIIVAHGGEIWVKDNIPKGTVFTFTLKSKEVSGLGLQ